MTSCTQYRSEDMLPVELGRFITVVLPSIVLVLELIGGHVIAGSW
jgi:hypothetical protein